MTFRDWFKDFEDAGEPPTLVSIILFAAVFLPAIFLVGASGPLLEQIQLLLGGLSMEWKAAGLTIVILGAMALTRIFTLILRPRA